MTKEIQNFITYMCEVKQISKNTELSYERDLRKVSVFSARSVGSGFCI